jgi:hypothetical protein
MDSRTLAKVVAKSIFYSSIQASIGSVEMSSKFSVMNFSKDQETLQRAADALKSYTIVGGVWTVGTMLALYASHSVYGAVIGLVSNMVMMGWIILSYIKAFKEAAARYGLEVPTVFNRIDLIWMGISMVAVAAGFWYLNHLNGGSKAKMF